MMNAEWARAGAGGKRRDDVPARSAGARPVSLGRRLVALPAAGAIFIIRLYQAYLRPHLFGNCKFDPTCSHYGIGCLERHGLIRGGWLTLRRLVRCHPFAKGGHDPVP